MKPASQNQVTQAEVVRAASNSASTGDLNLAPPPPPP